MAEKELRSIQFPGLEDVYVVPEGGGGATGPAGKDGLTPTIGANGNWYLGDEDTGKPSRGEKGIPGEKGADGAAGKDGYSPEATVTQINGGAKIIIKDENGTTSANVMNGAQGPKGDAGPQGDVGPKGDSYTLTTADKSEIAEAVVAGGVQAELGDEPVSLGITGATPGQIAKITAVDEKGVPTKWEPVDMAGGGWTVLSEGDTAEAVKMVSVDVDLQKIDEVLVFVRTHGSEPNVDTHLYWGVGTNETTFGISKSLHSSQWRLNLCRLQKIKDKLWVGEVEFGYSADKDQIDLATTALTIVNGYSVVAGDLNKITFGAYYYGDTNLVAGTKYKIWGKQQ